MMVGVPVDPDFCAEVAGIWKEILLSAPDKYKGREIYVTIERPLHVVMKNQVLGRLKSIAEHEFGADKVDVKWQPYFKVEIAVDGTKVLFASLSPYGGGVRWGHGISLLQWSEQQANENFAAFTR